MTLPERIVVGDSGHIGQHNALRAVSWEWVDANIVLEDEIGHGREHEILKAWYDALAGDPESLPDLAFTDELWRGVPDEAAIHRDVHERLHAFYNRLPVMDDD